MEIRLDRALFLLTAASYVFYPVWRLPVPWPAQWALLNAFVGLSVFALKGPLAGVKISAGPGALRGAWPAVLAAAAAALPFWVSGLPVGGDDQSHAGPAAFMLGRLAGLAGLDPAWLPLFALPAAGLLFHFRRRLSFPGANAAAWALAAAANLYFLADRLWGAAGAVGRLETVLRYPPLAKFLYLGSYLSLGINEAAPRAVQFILVSLAAACVIKLLRQAGGAVSAALSFLLAVFFPTFFNLAISAELEGGTLFFFAAAVYYFARAVRYGEKEAFLKAAFVISAGMLYKQLALGLLLAAAPALALLWAAGGEKRPFYAAGLRSLLIPAAAGLPFLFLSGRFGQAHTGFLLSNALDPAVMIAPFKNLYFTAGPWISGILACGTVYALARRPGPETFAAVYFSFVYYLLINMTGAAGFIRHAQPAYIAPVFCALMLANDAYAAAGRKAGALLAALLVAAFAWSAALHPAPFQRRTAANYGANIFPYGPAVRALRDEPGRFTVYAPMEVEPSHFYLGKYALAGRVVWDREMPAALGGRSAAEGCRRAACDYLLLPSSFVGAVPADFEAAAAELKASGEFTLVKEFDNKGNKLALFKPCAGY